MKTLQLFLPIVLLSCASFAQQATQQPLQPVVIHAGHMLDVKSGKMLDNVTVLIEGDKISAINSGSAPAGARLINLPNATLLPGLIDLHTHLTDKFGVPWMVVSQNATG